MGEELTDTKAILFAFVWTGLALFVLGNFLASRRAGKEKQ